MPFEVYVYAPRPEAMAVAQAMASLYVGHGQTQEDMQTNAWRLHVIRPDSPTVFFDAATSCVKFDSTPCYIERVSDGTHWGKVFLSGSYDGKSGKLSYAGHMLQRPDVDDQARLH